MTDKPYGEVLDDMDHQAKYQPATEPRAMKPLEPLLPGETRSEYLDRLERAEAGKSQQLVARIKRSSKYWGQTAPNQWFDVRVVTNDYYQLRGNQNNYRFSDVVMGVRIGDVVMDFKTGKSSK